MNDMQIEDISVGSITIVACRMPDGRDGWVLPGGAASLGGTGRLLMLRVH